MGLYNKKMEQLGLRVRIDREAYLIDGFGVMTIEVRLDGKWREIARVRLDGNEPNWDKLDCL